MQRTAPPKLFGPKLSPAHTYTQLFNGPQSTTTQTNSPTHWLS